jgi:hypothetical protein
MMTEAGHTYFFAMPDGPYWKAKEEREKNELRDMREADSDAERESGLESTDDRELSDT